MSEGRNMQNYATVNPLPNAEHTAWCLSPERIKKPEQVTVVCADGSRWNCGSRRKVQEGDVAVIGNGMPCYLASVEPRKGTGRMGKVAVVLPKLATRQSNTVDVDFVFTPDVTESMLRACEALLDLTRFTSKRFYDEIKDRCDQQVIYPITYRIEMLLAAASLLAHAELAGADAAERAKAYIHTPQDITRDMASVFQFDYTLADIDFGDIQVSYEDYWEEELDGLLYDELLFGDDRTEDIEPGLQTYVNKYAFIGAVSVMVRGGFVNLLQAFLSAAPPIGAFYDEMVRDIGDNGNAAALDILRSYVPEK